MEIHSIMNARKWEKHSFHRDLWLKENKHWQYFPEKKWEKYFFFSLRSKLCYRMFSFHSELSLTSLYLLRCDPGAGSSSRTSTLRAGYCCPESKSAPLPLIYTCLFLQSVFIALFFFPPTISQPVLVLDTQPLYLLFISKQHLIYFFFS